MSPNTSCNQCGQLLYSLHDDEYVNDGGTYTCLDCVYQGEEVDS